MAVIQGTQEQYRATWTSAKRKSYLEEHPENFAGPDGSYPIEDDKDVEHAWDLAGHADSPDAVRSKIKSIAKRLGLSGSLPDTATAKEKEQAARVVEPESPVEAAMKRYEKDMAGSGIVHLEDDVPVTPVDRAGNHAPYTGKHKHGHNSYDDSSEQHSHSHAHSDDNDHDHQHTSSLEDKEDEDPEAELKDAQQETKNRVTKAAAGETDGNVNDEDEDGEEDSTTEDEEDEVGSSEDTGSTKKVKRNMTKPVADEDDPTQPLRKTEKSTSKSLSKSSASSSALTASQDQLFPPSMTARSMNGDTPDSLSVYLPITRVDATSRTVTGQATVEKPDAYGTIFGYYPEAWKKWRGNMREQHDPKKAVGKAIEVMPDDTERAIYVTSKVSRGAQDTWLKIEDGVLTGYSASIIPDPEFGNVPSMWPKKEYNGKQYPYLPRYTVAETSYVDNPATPGCDITLVRADGMLTDVLDVEVTEVETTKPIERAGARIGSGTKSKMHASIGHTLQAAKAQMQNCDCPTCKAAARVLDPDDDGDVDFGGFDDPDGKAENLYKDTNLTIPKGESATSEREIIGVVERSLSPVYSRLQGIATQLAKSNTQNIENVITSSVERAVATLQEKVNALTVQVATQTNIDELRSSLEEVKGQVVRIAEQPLPGGPVFNTGGTEKRLPTDSEAEPVSYGSVYDAIRTMNAKGGLNTVDKQVQAMAAGLTAQRPRR